MSKPSFREVVENLPDVPQLEVARLAYKPWFNVTQNSFKDLDITVEKYTSLTLNFELSNEKIFYYRRG